MESCVKNFLYPNNRVLNTYLKYVYYTIFFRFPAVNFSIAGTWEVVKALLKSCLTLSMTLNGITCFWSGWGQRSEFL